MKPAAAKTCISRIRGLLPSSRLLKSQVAIGALQSQCMLRDSRILRLVVGPSTSTRDRSLVAHCYGHDYRHLSRLSFTLSQATTGATHSTSLFLTAYAAARHGTQRISSTQYRLSLPPLLLPKHYSVFLLLSQSKYGRPQKMHYRKSGSCLPCLFLGSVLHLLRQRRDPQQPFWIPTLAAQRVAVWKQN